MLTLIHHTNIYTANKKTKKALSRICCKQNKILYM